MPNPWGCAVPWQLLVHAGGSARSRQGREHATGLGRLTAPTASSLARAHSASPRRPPQSRQPAPLPQRLPTPPPRHTGAGLPEHGRHRRHDSPQQGRQSGQMQERGLSPPHQRWGQQPPSPLRRLSRAPSLSSTGGGRISDGSFADGMRAPDSPQGAARRSRRCSLESRREQQPKEGK